MIMPRSLTDEQAKEVVEAFKAGTDSMQQAARLGVSDTTIRRYLRLAGIEETDSRIKITPDRRGEAAQQYLAGVSTIRLAKELGVSPETVSSALREEGIVLRPRGAYRQLPLRESAFDAVTPESAYWLGMMATDGCVTGTGGIVDMVQFGLKLSDYHHVMAFRSFLGSGHKVRLATWKHDEDMSDTVSLGWRFVVRSRQLVRALVTFGIVPCKTYCLAARRVEENLDFWRGAVDGDGHLGIHASNQGPDATLKLSGASETFLIQFRDYLRKNGVRGEANVVVANTKGSKAKVPKYDYKLGGNAALDAAALLYTDDCQAMPRKARAAAEMILRGSRGELVGTIRVKWTNNRAVEWARRYLDTNPTAPELVLPQDAADQMLALTPDVLEKLAPDTIQFIEKLRGQQAVLSPAG